MSWIKMNMRFPGTCIVCKKPVKTGERGLWARGVGVKHIGCAEQNGISCIICGKPAGCSLCELYDSCDIQRVSPLCVCSECSGSSLEQYRAAAARKFPALAVKD